MNAFEGVWRLLLASRNRSESPPPHGMSHVAKRVLILQLKVEDILGTLHRRMAAGDSANCGTTDPVTPSKPLKQNYGETKSTEHLGVAKYRRLRLRRHPKAARSTPDNGFAEVVDTRLE